MKNPMLPVPPPGTPDYERRLNARLDQLFRQMRAAEGWKDNKASLSTAKVGGGAGSSPSWAAMGASGIYGWQFANNALNECWINFHLTHDLQHYYIKEDGTQAAGPLLFPHVHWSPDGTDTGTARFGIEYTYAQGYGVDAFSATTTTIYLEQASDGTQYGHFIAETTEAEALVDATFETDGLLLCRVFRDGAHANDTLTDGTWIWFVDFHYLSDGKETQERNRNSTGTIPWTKQETV